jgi:anti-anti-sigma regulatory factor
MLATERDDSALLPGMFRLAVAGPDDPQATLLAVNGPFALIGRDEHCACQLKHGEVSRRHAYIQAIFGRMFCIDLGSRTGTFWGDSARKSGWLDPQVPIRVGPYQVQVVDSIGLGAPSASFPENFSPLGPYTGQLGPLPRVEVEILNGTVPSAEMTIARPITLVGSSPRCKLRLQHTSVAKVDCSLLWLPDGLWVVDLSGRGHSRLRGKVLRCARLENEQTLRLGRFHLRVHYSSMGTISMPPAVGATPRSSQISKPAPMSPREKLEDELPMIVVEGMSEEEPSPSRKPFLLKTPVGSGTIEDERMSLMRERQEIAEQRQIADARERALQAREIKLSEAQGRLASEWEHLHVDRAAHEAMVADLIRRQDELAGWLRRLAEDTDLLGRQRIELANRTAEVLEFKQRLTDEAQKFAAQSGIEVSLGNDNDGPLWNEPRPNHDMSGLFPPPMADESACPTPESASSNGDGGAESGRFDALESVRHNKVFAADRAGATLIVTPLGDASEFIYADVHVESNKVRRLLEGGAFKNLVVDLGSAAVYSAVTINVVVALSRIASNRGGRAVLCSASEKTRSLLQTMRLLDVWPLFDSREGALQALAEPAAG